jgi:hypothetical protein
VRPSKSANTTSLGLVKSKPVSALPRPRISIAAPLALRALTWPVVSLNNPSLARMQQDNATFFANAESIEEFWILDFRFWIGKLPLKLRG